MNGLSLARDYYAACRPILLQAIPDIMERAAVGLAGEGSECLGCDDACSRDHDFGPAFCLWLPRAELRDARERIDAALARLPREFHGLTSHFAPEGRRDPANGRVGPLAIEDFYVFFHRPGPAALPLAQGLCASRNTSWRPAPAARSSKTAPGNSAAGAKPCWPVTRATSA